MTDNIEEPESIIEHETEPIVDAMEQMQKAGTLAPEVAEIELGAPKVDEKDAVFIRVSSTLPPKLVGIEKHLQALPYDSEQWLVLITESAKYDIEYTRAAIQKAFYYFPNAIRLWILAIDLECRMAGILLSSASSTGQNTPPIDMESIPKIEKLFATCLKTVVHPELWRIYIVYLKKKGGSNMDKNVLQKAYEYALQHIGSDPDSGVFWSEYIEFLRQGKPANQYEEQLKMDLLRKTWQRAITLPLANLETLWRDYDSFENSLNKLTVSQDARYDHEHGY